MNVKAVLLSITIIPMFTTACATQKSATKPEFLRGSDCVFFRTLYDWQALDDSNLVIWAPGRRDAYQVQLSAPLFGINSEWRVAFVDADHDGRLCGFSTDKIAIGDRSSFPQQSTISAMKKLDAAGLAKLEEKYKTKLTRDAKKQKPKEPERETAK